MFRRMPRLVDAGGYAQLQRFRSSGENGIDRTPTFLNGHCLELDGVDEAVDAGNVPLLDFERTDPFTLSCWVKTTYAGGSSVHLMSKRLTSGVRPGYSLAYRPGSSLFIVVMANNDVTNNDIDKRFNEDTAINDNAWHHVCLTYDGSSDASGVLVYVDTVSQSVNVVNSNNLSATMKASAPFLLGARAWGNYFPGRICQAAVWAKEFSAAEVTTLYNGGVPFDLRDESNWSVNRAWWWCGDRDENPNIHERKNDLDGTMLNMGAANIIADSP